MGSLQKAFDVFLQKYKNDDIGIYGTGYNAELIIKDVEGYKFDHIISNDRIGEIFCNRRVCSIEEALPYISALIIAATPMSTQIVYDRIKDIVPKNIPIFSMLGIQLNLEQAYIDNPYWKLSKRDIYNEIDKHDIISFDLFDTLIMRKTLYPSDIFSLIEEKTGIRNFAERRIAAEKACNKAIKCPELETIYSYFDSIADKEDIINIEMQTEADCLLLRDEVVELLKYAEKSDRKVIITSDMYLSEEKVRSIFNKNGWHFDGEIFISCDEKRSKHNGELFEYISDKYDSQSILHIGDNYQDDYLKAKDSGIDAIYIMSSIDMLRNSSVAELENSAKNLSDRMYLGTMIAEYFNNPFALNNTCGKVCIKDIKALTRLTLFPITKIYLAWLKEKITDSKNTLFLFISRDGYFPYIYLKELDGINNNRIAYFYASRQGTVGITCQTIDDIKAFTYWLDEKPEENLKDNLEATFCVKLNDDFNLTVREAKLKWKDLFWDKISEILPQIKEKYQNHRKNYIKYLNLLELNNYDNVIVLDLVTHGTVRYAISQLSGKEVKMFALATSKLPNALIPDTTLSESVFGEIFSPCYPIGSYYHLLEIGFASKDGQFMYMDDNDKPVFKDETKYNAVMLDEIQTQLLDLLHKPVGYSEEISDSFAEKSLSMLDSKYTDISSEVYDKFDVIDYTMNKPKQNVLKRRRGEEH